MKKHTPRINRLFFDLEVSPNVGLFWRPGYEVNIDHGNIIQERAIICVGYKWEHEKKAHVICWDKDQDDKALLAEFLKIANTADEIVAHNGDRFDIPWLRGRCIFHGLEPMPRYKSVDTLQWARRNFGFNSNRLDYIAKYLGMGGKIKTEFGLWKDIVLHKCPKALKRMAEYCARDVELLQKVYARMEPYTTPKTHVGVASGSDKWTCPKCGGTDVRIVKTTTSAAGTTRTQMQCNDDGRYFTISAAARKEYLEWKKEQEKEAA